jgi:hypothetical protein
MQPEGRFIMTETYKWHEVYIAAVLETDWTKMEERIQAVEAALHERKYEFDLNHGGSPEENRVPPQLEMEKAFVR